MRLASFGFWTVLRDDFRHVRHPRAFHIIELMQEFRFLARMETHLFFKDGEGIKVSTVDAAGGERVGLSGLLVRHTPMFFVIALESVRAMCV